LNPLYSDGDKKGSVRGLFLVAPLGFIALSLLWCQVGYLTPTFSRALGAVLWLLVVYLAAKDKKFLWLILSAILLFNPYGAVHRPEGLWLLGLLPWAGGIWGKRWMGAAWIAALGGWIWANHPGLWVPIDEFTASVAHWFTKANLSSAAAGLPLLAIAVCFPLASMLNERRFAKPMVAIVGLIVTLIAYWWLQKPVEATLHRQGIHGIHDAFSLQWVLLILIGLVLTLWGIFDPPGAVDWKKRGTLAVPILVLMEVVFYNKGYLNWKVPVYGSYGRGSAGMFGLIPDYLRWSGFNVNLADTLSPEVMNNAGVVVIVNLMDSLSEPEESALHRFVEEGGSLLLLGDHTGMQNIRDPSNRLLEPYGIELNFDSAKPTRTGWAGSLVCAQHPLTSRLGLIRQGGKKPGATQIWVGASLKATPPGRPLIVGRDGFSDAGDSANVKDGYLGDFRYRPDERLGNLVLLAQARAGEGKVLVFGDTSTLQNGALLRSRDFARRIFAYLLSPVKETRTQVRTAGLLLIAGAILAWGLSGGATGGLALGAVALFIAAGFCQYRTATFGDGLAYTWSEATPPRALLDFSHSPRTPLNQTGGDGQWGLQNCLMRSGFLPQAMERWDEGRLYDARILVEIAPAKKFGGQEREAINRFMQGGGLVMLCCGMEEFDGSKSLLKEYGLEPIYVPLGPAELDSTPITLPVIGDTTDRVTENFITLHFHKAWQIEASNPLAEMLLSLVDTSRTEIISRPVVAYVGVGKGGLLYFSDTDFLTNRNLESPSGDYYEDNILYLRYLLMKFADGK